MKLKRTTSALSYYLEPISKELIDDYKSSNNMLRHARFIPSISKGFMAFDSTTKDPIGVIWENDFIVAFEVFKDYRKLGYGKELLSKAVEFGAKKLSVNKSNIVTIKLYESSGWKVYGEKGAMLFMEKEGN